MSEVIIETEGLKTYFKQKRRAVVKAVDDVSLKICEGETLGLVGESGCGKSTLGRTILNLVPATEGSVYLRGEDICRISAKKMWGYRKKMQLIFQNPYSSLNPRMTIRESVEAPLKVYKEDKKTRKERVQKILEDVGLGARYLDRFPHEFSGGQRQRIGIARALAVNPEFLLCDEPISALDVSVQAQIVNLLVRLQKERGLTSMFIAHDLSMVKHISDRVGVMYLGNMVELAASRELYRNPLHPYTQALLSAIPIPNPEIEKNRKQIHLAGEIPSPMNPPKGCHFCNRCSRAKDRCRMEAPVLREVEPQHYVACHLQ